MIDEVEPDAAEGDLTLGRLPRSRPENPIITGTVELLAPCLPTLACRR